MKLGFVSAILPDCTLEEVLQFAADEGFSYVELMCWPSGKAERRYAGVTHLDVTAMTPEYIQHVRSLVQKTGVRISGLGYYPNPLDPDLEQRAKIIEHLKQVIRAAPLVGVKVVNTFIGRDPKLTVAENLELVKEIWPSILAEAEAADVRIGIEHCPMLFSDDEWPGGKNLAISPAIWRELLKLFPGGRLGLNFDPSHLIWQNIDCARAIREFSPHFVHVHAKDERIDTERLYEVGIMGLGWHKPKLPGMGNVNWSEFFAALTDSGYDGPVCIEVEDRAYERSLEDRKRAIRQSKKFLDQFFG